mmetsp:Transcript_4195/g.14747  ORF Transcript_4195/g.14747 Transcript_4195/m.14747 type:complete len:230 (-) Transcript_4195:1156-1845(-)
MSCLAPRVGGIAASLSRSQKRPSRRDFVGARGDRGFAGDRLESSSSNSSSSSAASAASAAFAARSAAATSSHSPSYPHTSSAICSASLTNLACATASSPCRACGAMSAISDDNSDGAPSTRAAPKMRLAASASVSSFIGGGASAMRAFSGPLPSKYLTFDRQIAIACCRISRTAKASISASPRPNGGGCHLEFGPSFAACFAADSRCSFRISLGSALSSSLMKLAAHAT